MKEVSTSFKSFIFESEEERVAAHTFTPESLALFQTLKAEAAEAILALRPDPNNVLLFIQKEATLRGQIQVLDYILTLL